MSLIRLLVGLGWVIGGLAGGVVLARLVFLLRDIVQPEFLGVELVFVITLLAAFVLWGRFWATMLAWISSR